MGFTQEGLAAAVGVEFSTVGRWERGALTPQPWRRPRIATALDVSLDELDALLGQVSVGAPTNPSQLSAGQGLPGQPGGTSLSLQGSAATGVTGYDPTAPVDVEAGPA
ncbi:MAG: helix-turn-helix domain-containing protein [Sciscionella sp.]